MSRERPSTPTDPGLESEPDLASPTSVDPGSEMGGATKLAPPSQSVDLKVRRKAKKIQEAFDPTTIAGVEIEAPDAALRLALWHQIKEMGLKDLKDGAGGGLNLSAQEPEELAALDLTRLARMVYNIGYVRLVELAARPTKTLAEQIEVAKLLLAYIRHIETAGREILKLDPRKQADQHLDRAMNEMSEELIRITEYKRSTPAWAGQRARWAKPQEVVDVTVEEESSDAEEAPQG